MRAPSCILTTASNMLVIVFGCKPRSCLACISMSSCVRWLEAKHSLCCCSAQRDELHLVNTHPKPQMPLPNPCIPSHFGSLIDMGFCLALTAFLFEASAHSSGSVLIRAAHPPGKPWRWTSSHESRSICGFTSADSSSHASTRSSECECRNAGRYIGCRAGGATKLMLGLRWSDLHLVTLG